MKNFKIYPKAFFSIFLLSFLAVFTFAQKLEDANSKYKHHTSTYGPILACNGSPKDCFVLNGRIHVIKELEGDH